MSTWEMKMCRDCLRLKRELHAEKRENKKLRKENKALREEKGCAHRTINEAPFGSSTPSSKLVIKPGTTEERQARKGGAKPGHKGTGRKAQEHRPQRPVEVVRLSKVCPDCAAELAAAASRTRTLVGCEPPKTFTRTVILEEAWCPCCRKTIRTQTPEAFPNMLLDNSTLAYVAVEHYLNGVTLGRLAKITGIAKGTLINAMHSLARLLKAGHGELQKELRAAAVIFADETTWRNDGANGYAWMFRTYDLVLYRFCGTRAGTIPEGVLGKLRLSGVLVTDRYAGYNGIEIDRQYCYAHLLRDLQDLEKEFPDTAEVKRFVAALAPLLADAMALRRVAKDPATYRRRAKRLACRIRELVSRSANHAGVQWYQDIFRKNENKLYHWVKSSDVPPDNNYAESSLRPTVIARKMSYGSQSVRGAETREIMMSIIGTIAMRNADPWNAFRETLNRVAETPPDKRDIAKLLFHPASAEAAAEKIAA
jgi:transposase